MASGKWQTQWGWNTNANDRMLKSITHPIAPGVAQSDGSGWMRELAAWLGITLDHPVVPHAAVFATAQGITYTTVTGQVTGRAQGADSWVYKYDPTNRLWSAAYGGTGTGQGAQYTYDGADNPKQIATTNPVTTENYVPNADNQVASTNGAVAALASQELGIPVPTRIVAVQDLGDFVPGAPAIVQQSIRYFGGGTEFLNTVRIEASRILASIHFP